MSEHSGNAAIDQGEREVEDDLSIVLQNSQTALDQKIAAADCATLRCAKSRLRMARSRISNPDNWTQGTSSSRPDGSETSPYSMQATKWCAVGSMASTGSIFDPHYLLAMGALDTAALRRGHAGIVALNDAPDTAHQDVLATFDEAAALLDEPTCGCDAD